MDFNDRFIINDSTFPNINLDTITDEQLAVQSPLLFDMVTVVRTFSVLIKRKTIKEIHSVIVNQSDPRIALILAAGRDKSGNQLFPNLGVIKAFMFGIADSTILNADVSFNDNNIFVNGLKRISCALTAATLIGQLSQVTEQANHAIVLEKQAIADIDRLLQVPEVQAAAEALKAKEASLASKPTLYFEPKRISVGSRILTVSVYLSAVTSLWEVVGSYTDAVDVGKLIADICDYINFKTLTTNTSNILASPCLGGLEKLHTIEFESRLRDLDISTELVSVKFSFSDAGGNLLELPFIWGVDKLNLQPYAINSCIIQVDAGKTANAITATTNESYDLSVIYFRRRIVNDAGDPLVPVDGSIESLTYRISPTMTENLSLDIEYDLVNELDRPNLVATTLLNSLFSLKLETKALGSIIQNDPTSLSIYYSALQLVAWTVTNIETELVLDILEVPEDIEIALGNIKGPLSNFSNKPRSIRVKTTFDPNANVAAALQEDNTGGYARLVKSKQSKLLQQLNDIRRSDYKPYSRSLNLKNKAVLPPPNIYPYY